MESLKGQKQKPDCLIPKIRVGVEYGRTQLNDDWFWYKDVRGKKNALSPDDGKFGEGNRRKFESVRKVDHLHSTWTL